SYTGSNLTGIANPDGGLRTLAYDGSHRLTQDSFGVLSATYAYSSGALSGYTQGDGGSTAVSPAALLGLSAPVAAPLWATLTDPLGRVTREQLDTSGRPLAVVSPDGGLTQYTRDSNGWVTTQTDPLSRVTTFTLDSAGYPTQVTFPDGNSRAYQYQT